MSHMLQSADYSVCVTAFLTCQCTIFVCIVFIRKQLDLRLQPGGADFREALAREVASVEQRQAHREAELQEKLLEGRTQYAALEDEFRMALTIEAARFSEV